MSNEAVSYTREESVTVICLDDGKANAFSHAVLDALDAAIDRAEKDDAKALVLVGREGTFSAGFDLSVMTKGVEAAMELAAKGARLAMRVYNSPRPVVLGVTGHAMATVVERVQ